MSRGIIIAGNESNLLSAIETETARRVEQYTLAAIPNRFIGIDAKPSSAASLARIPLDWNPGSPITARTLILAAENRLGCVDEAILVCDPPRTNRSINDINLADVEILVHDHIKGWFFLAKELAVFFKTKGEGTLALVYPETGGNDDLLGATALAAFRSFTRNLLSAVGSEPYLTLGFAGGESGDEAGFAAFISKQLEERNPKAGGKLHKYGKASFFK